MTFYMCSQKRKDSALGLLKLALVASLNASLILASPSIFAFIPEQQKSLNTKEIPLYIPTPLLTYKDVSEMIPTNMAPTENGSDVGNRILDKSIQSLLNGGYFQNMAIVQKAKSVEKAMQTNVSLGGSDGGIKHNIEMQLDAFQSQARLKYSGLMDAHVFYSANDVVMAINQPLSKTVMLTLDHHTSTDVSMLRINLPW